MPQNLRIAVITHALDRFENSGYLLQRLIDLWEPRGVEVEVVRGADGPPAEADLAISHIDMTVVEDEYARLFEHYPLVVNGRVRDISKSAFSDQIITRDDIDQGPVIVKTDRNFGGLREMRAQYLAGDLNATIDIQRPWRRVEYLPAYPAFDSPAAVPLGVWRNPNLVVEKFRPERIENGKARARMKSFFVSPTDPGGFHLTIFSTQEFLAQLANIYLHVAAGYSRKERETWMRECTIASRKTIRDAENIRIEMDFFGLRKVGDGVASMANCRVFDDEGGLFTARLKGLLR